MQVSYQSNLGGSSFDWVTHFDPIKIANFDADRWKFFHYCLFAKQYNNSLRYYLVYLVHKIGLLTLCAVLGYQETFLLVISLSLLAVTMYVNSSLLNFFLPLLT